MQTKGGVAHSNPRPARVSPTNLSSESWPRARLAYQFVRPTPPLAYLMYALTLSTPSRTPSPTNWPFPTNVASPPLRSRPLLSLSHALASRHLSLAPMFDGLYTLSLSLSLSRSFTSLRLSLAPTRNWTLSSLFLPRPFASARALTKSCATDSLSHASSLAQASPTRPRTTTLSSVFLALGPKIWPRQSADACRPTAATPARMIGGRSSTSRPAPANSRPSSGNFPSRRRRRLSGNRLLRTI
jgi:hypothetical protein